MKLNADVGEGVGDDATLFQWIDMANVACGYHAGDLQTMTDTVLLASRYGVAVGAHPGYHDREGFGRRSVAHLPGEIKRLVIDQVDSLNRICQREGEQLRYVKPHGALYHDMMSRIDVYEEILLALASFPYGMALMIQARMDNTVHQQLAEQHGVPLLFEAFADRAYTDDGDLLDRDMAGAVYESPEQMVKQVKQLKEQGSVTSVSGRRLPIQTDSICVHGDNEASIRAAKQLHQLLKI